MSMRAQPNIYLLAIFSTLFPIVTFAQDLISEEDAQAAANSSSLIVPKELRQPQSEEELAQQPILLAISQREYERAEQLFETASQNEPQKSLITSAKFAPQLRGLESFWRSIEGGLQRVKSGDQLALPKHLLARDEKLSAWISKPVTSNADSQSTPTIPKNDSESESDPPSKTIQDTIQVKVLDKNENQLVLSNPDYGNVEIPTDMAEMPTALAVALFRYQFPNSNANATALFEKFDFPGHPQLAASKIASKENGATKDNLDDKTQMEGQEDDAGSDTSNLVEVNRSTDTRLPVPQDSDQKKSRAEIKRLFDILYSSKAVGSIQERAKKLMQAAQESSAATNATDIYVLLDEALEAAVSIADAKLSLSISTEMAKRFQVDPDTLFVSTCKNVLVKATDPASAEAMMVEVRTKVDGWINDDNYAIAKKALSELSPIIRRLRLQHWINYVGSEQNRVRVLSKKYSDLIAAVGKENSPKVEPNSTVQVTRNWPAPDKLSKSHCELIGKFLVFDKEKLESGLPYLARATSLNLREIAQMETKPPQSIDEKILLAEKWLEIDDQPFAAQRARSIYLRILSTATGLTEARVRKKLEEIKAPIGGPPAMREFLGKTFTITWVYVDGSGSKDEIESLVFMPDGTYRREQPAGAVEGTWTELDGEISTKITTRQGCSEAFKLLPGGFLSGMHYRGEKPIARCHGQVSD